MILSAIKHKIRTSDGFLYRTARSTVRCVLTLHIPVFWLTRPLFRFLYALHVLLRESLILLAKFFWYEPLFRARCSRVGPGLQMEKLPYITGEGRILLGSRVRLSGKSSIGFNSRFGIPEFSVGDNTFIGHACSFALARSITIGSDCLLASSVHVADNDGHPLDPDRRRRGLPVSPDDVKPVVIEDNVWIGTGAHIMKGVTIGAGSVVGAASVVTKDVPPFAVVAGCPARVLKQLSPPPENPRP